MNIVFTKHALDQIKKRKITEDEVISTIKYASQARKVGDKHIVENNIGRGIIRVVFKRENYIKVLTVHWLP